ncbi:MAG: dihydrofolate reductase family protein [Actinobacteria bacterium]|nr:dihydrofolate reductase family protein [Actinomycetota bacterium]
MTFQGLEVLFEEQGLPELDLPPSLRDLYGGSIGFDGPLTYANFVTSLDGVAALPKIKDSPVVLSGKSEADRFVMGLLRALADAVVIGAGTMRNAEGHLWTADYVYPALAEDFQKLRGQLKRSTHPALIVLTASGKIPPSHPALERGAIFLTNEQTAKDLSVTLPKTCRVEVLGSGSRLDPKELQRFLHSEGFGSVLSEAGPELFAQLMGAGLVDELFLTSSPRVAGRANEPRPGFVDGLEFLPNAEVSGKLASVRRSGSYLFLRYRFERNHHSL